MLPMLQTPSPAELLAKMTPDQRRRAADALAISHRFKPEPRLKQGKPHYAGRTVEQVSHYKSKA
jgi:hypothetical protein